MNKGRALEKVFCLNLASFYLEQRMSKAASIQSAVRRPLSFERGSLTLFGSLAVLIAGLVSLDTGLTGV